jgi:hypothetical protein
MTKADIDDTFRILKRIPINEMNRLVKEYLNTEDFYWPPPEFFKEYGWTRKEFNEEYVKHRNVDNPWLK